MIKTFYVPVVDIDNNPLMPTILTRAHKWIKTGKATPFWKKGVWCVRLNKKIENSIVQPIVVGVDPGSKKEGFTVKSTSHTYLNLQTDSIDWVKDNVETRRMMRRNRRNRKTPCRKPRWNRSGLKNKNRIPPSTKARWQWKLRILNWLKQLFPINFVIVEDICAETKVSCKKWNKSFSPLEVGKKWFYSQIDNLQTKFGYETANLRKELGLTKNKNKLSNYFDAHCVDSWVLANSVVGGHKKPDNIMVMTIKPLRFYRRQLHVMVPAKGGIRKKYGGTMSLGFKRGGLVKHKKYGLTYVGGTSNNRITLHCIETGERLNRNIKPEDCKFITYLKWI